MELSIYLVVLEREIDKILPQRLGHLLHVRVWVRVRVGMGEFGFGCWFNNFASYSQSQPHPHPSFDANFRQSIFIQDSTIRTDLPDSTVSWPVRS